MARGALAPGFQKISQRFSNEDGAGLGKGGRHVRFRTVSGGPYAGGQALTTANALNRGISMVNKLARGLPFRRHESE